MYRLRWCLILVLLAIAQLAQAVGSDRFLERLSTETRNDKLVVRVHFTQRLQYLSHTPANNGDQVTIRFRSLGSVVIQKLTNEVLGKGARLLQPVPDQAARIDSVSANGNLDTDPSVVVDFRQALDFEVRAGPDTRSIEIILKKEVTAAAAGKLDPENVEQGLVALPAGSTPERQHLPDLFRRARSAIQTAQYQRAMAIYDRIIASGIEPYRREAIITLGMVRAELGQNARAIAQYQLYLMEYPDGPEARRVQRYLDTIIAAQAGAISKADSTDEEAVSAASQWHLFGSFDQFYLLDRGEIGERGSETYRSGLLSSTNVSWRGRSGNLDISGRFSGSYDFSFLSGEKSPARVSYLYLDLAGAGARHEARLGRQRLSGSGVLGYFDGLHYQFRINDQQSLRYVGGAPMRSTRDGVDSDRLFNGLAVDFHAADDSWFLSLYGMNQTFDRDTDRRALGAEARYFGDSFTAYALLDYDIYFDKLNIFHLYGNWRVRPGTVASLTLDYRRTPGLTLSNALLGQGLDDFDDLRPELTKDDLKRLALDRSLVYRSLYLSLSQQLTARWQALLDAGLYLLRDESSVTEGVTNLDSDDWYLYTQLVGNSLIKPGDMFSAGLRYTDAERMNLSSLQLRARIPVRERWQTTPRLRVDYRDRGRQ